MNKKLHVPSVALVYDRVNTPYGGAENVLQALHQAFPTAPLFTSVYSKKHAPWAKQFPFVQASFLNLPFFSTSHRWLAWLMPLAFESLKLAEYDIVISVTSAEAKGVLTQPHQLHLCYLLTPPRYVYHSQAHSLDSHWLLRLPVIWQLARLTLSYLRWWDQAAIFRPDVIIPISQRVAERVKEFYPAVKPDQVIYPPVQVPSKQSGNANTITKPYFLVVSRLVSHKKIDLAIQACAQLHQNLVIIGEGPDLERLNQLAQISKSQHAVTFFSSASNQELYSLYAHCQAVIMPGEEDFGIVALEANAFGKPVIINQKSGAAELIRPGIHGIHIAGETADSVAAALKKYRQTSFSVSKIQENPLKYDANSFIRQFSRLTHQQWERHQAKL